MLLEVPSPSALTVFMLHIRHDDSLEKGYTGG